ncbi:hypothetical protein GXB85_13525 [Cellulomonas sp. APG4]|uniref:HEPN domain-containing protein n=1 Tax=Cellulomonas sp. APG4 TaxID=1538656 RepID=UPI001379F80F|nr:hypothetical protein [Cellulomonas sp. APG4]
MSESIDVLDETLFQLTMDVVREMDARATEYLARDDHKFVPKRRRRSVTAFDSGWPSVGSDVGATETDAIAYGKLFASTRDAIHPIAYEDLGTMASLVAYVHDTPALLQRVGPTLREDAPVDLARSVIDMIIRNLPTDIYDRAKALGFELDGPDIVNLYQQRERSWLAPELSRELVVPLVLTSLELEDTFEVDSHARIEALGDDDLRAMASDYDISGVPGPVADAARFAVVVDMPPLTNPGEGRRFLKAEDPPDTAGVDLICEALRIVSSADTGWARVFQRPRGWAARWKDALPAYSLLQTTRRYPSVFDDFGWLRSGRTVTRHELERLPAATRALGSADKRVRLASRRLSTAVVRDAADDQLVDACIGLEALLGQKGAELSFRIAMRAAALLSSRANTPVSAEEVFDIARTVYARRSEIVHGSTSERAARFPVTGAETTPTSDLAVWLLRQILQERLLREDRWSLTDLDSLVLRRLEPS